MMDSAHSERPSLMAVVAERHKREEVRRNTRLLVCNGGLVFMAMTFVSSDLVLPAFVQTLSKSSIMIGLAGALMRIGWAWPQVFVSRLVEPLPRKMPVFWMAGLARSSVWFVVGALTFYLGDRNHGVLLASFMALYGIATSLMGMTNVPWMDIIGKSIPSSERARMFAIRRLVGGLMAMVAGGVISFVLSKQSGLDFPSNYAVLFMFSGLGTALSVWAFTRIREPVPRATRRRMTFRAYMLSGLGLLRDDPNYRQLCLVQFLWAFSMMAAPFYVPFAIEGYGISAAYVGFFVSVMQFSSIFSNGVWAWVGHRKGNQALLVYGTYFLGLSIAMPMLAGLMPERMVQPLGFVGIKSQLSLQIAVYALTFVFSGFATSGMFTGRMTYVLDIAPPDRRPTYTSFMNAFMLPQGILPVLGGMLVAWISYQDMFLIALVFIPLSALLARRLKDVREIQQDAA